MEVLSIRNMATVYCDSAEKRSRLVRLLTLQSKYDATTLLLYNTFTEEENIEIPIGLIPRPVETRPWERITIQFKGMLRSEQPLLVDSYLNWLHTHSGGIIQSPTGSGKTVMAVNILTQIGLKTLIIVPTDYLMMQWHKQLKTFSNLRDEDIGMARGSTCVYVGKKVVIGMIHSLSKIKQIPA